jgi:FkbH-like protein
VLVPEWPQDKRLYPSALLAMNCFETAGVTTEDRTRTAMYSAERRRDALKTESASLDQWLHALQTRVAVASLDAANSGRVAQLLNKTNQFNLRTRRCTEVELTDWASAPGHVLLACRVRDRFGDSGIVGIASVSLAGSEAHIEDFVLSCRVMGRGVEEAMLHALSESARRRGAARLVATHAPTPKNAPCLEFFRRSGLCEVSRGCFIWSLDDSYPLPRHVELLDQTTIAPEAAATSV